MPEAGAGHATTAQAPPTTPPPICAACSLLALRGVKTTTGIVGLPADPQARQHLEEKCRAVLEALEANGIPTSAEYRRAVEKTINYR